MNFLQRRDRQKKGKQILNDAVHARLLREDVADPALVAAQVAAEKEFEAAILHEDRDVFVARANALSAAVDKVYPPAPHPSMRGWVEIILVAFAVAWGFRTFFFQPYKIPTGSMQPTLYGITARPLGEGESTNPLYWSVRAVLTGEWLSTFKAHQDGTVKIVGRNRDHYVFYQVQSDADKLRVRAIPEAEEKLKSFKIYESLPMMVHEGQRVTKGQVLAQGVTRAGDHLFVNRMKYNFFRPQRGEVVVFRTEGIAGLTPGDFYIKRLVGLPGESMSISRDGWLQANGRRVTEPASFTHTFLDRFVTQGKDPRMAADPANQAIRINGVHALPIDHGPYVHYGADGILTSPAQRIQLSERQFLFFGDNTTNSQDGRYFGGVDRDNITGTAGFVMWPFVGRAGPIRWRE